MKIGINDIVKVQQTNQYVMISKKAKKNKTQEPFIFIIILTGSVFIAGIQ